MDENTVKSRVRAIRRVMRAKKVDWLIITQAANVTYVTGFLGDDSWAIIGRRGVYLVTDSRYIEQAEGECVGCKVVDNNRDMAGAIGKIMARAKGKGSAGVEESCSVAEFRELRKRLTTRVKAVGGIVEAVRRAKDGGEVRAIRRAVKVAWEALDETIKYLRAGVSESAAAGKLDFEMRKRGCMVSFDTIMAFGANGSRNHHQPGGRKLRRNDTILIDFGALYNGYHCDMTRSFVFGKAGRGYEKAYYAVAEALRAGIDKVRDGASVKEVDSAGRQVLAKRGMDVYGHGTGHGLGLMVHEIPYIAKESKGKLRAGDVITIEPGVYLPGRFGIRLEDDFLVTEKGCKLLSGDGRFGFDIGRMPVIRSR